MMNCRHCNTPLQIDFLDMGFAPPSNAYLNADGLNRPETYFPLRLKACSKCRLVQTEDYAAADQLFSEDYAYFSSTSKGWLDHAARYCDMAQERFDLDANSFVVEIASNDGYLLKNFVKAGIPCLGIEPTDSTADAAEALGIPVWRKFFDAALGQEMAQSGQSADLIIGNNVFAHVPDINSFTSGIRHALKPEGVVTLEFPHLMRLVEFNQFDTVYHEHFSYLSLIAVSSIFDLAGLRIFDVEELPTHGGSLRVFGCRKEASHSEHPAVSALLAEERSRGMDQDAWYEGFQAQADATKDAFIQFLLNAKREGKSVAAYGAAAKGNTLLNYAGIKPDLLSFVCDAAEAKIGKYLPGSHLPIYAPDYLDTHRPDYLVVLPWNISREVFQQLDHLAKSGTKFVTAIPSLTIT